VGSILLAVLMAIYCVPLTPAVLLLPFFLLLALNPMTGVVSGFRWALLGDASAVTGLQAPAALASGLAANCAN
jgi:hypothetical protein